MRKDAESGYVLVTVAALLFVLVGFTALAVDMGSVLTSRTQLQRAADAAALAAAYEFAQSPTATDTTAKQKGNAVLAANKNFGTAIDTGTGVTWTIKCPSGCSDGTLASAYQAKVEISRTESTVFAGVLDVAGIADKVTAVAEVATTANGATCIKPWFVPNTVADTVNTPCDANTAGNVLISNNALTQFGKNNFGAALTVKAQDPSNALQPGQFFEIDMSQYGGQGGAAAYTNAISGCQSYQFMCQSSYATLSGNKMGPTTQGVCSLIYGDKNCHGTADTYISPGVYNWADGSGYHDTSKSLVMAPIVDLSSVSGFCPGNQLPNNATVPVVGFASVFIGSADKASDSIVAYVVNVWACGASSGSDTSNTGSPLPLRLVRTQ